MKTTLALLSAAALLAFSVQAGAADAPAQTPLPSWKDYLQKLMPAGDTVLKASPIPVTRQVEQETWATMFSALSNGYIAHVYADPDYPELVSTFNMALNLALPNPDFMYTWTPIRDEGVYRIRGFRNTARFVQFALLEGYYTQGNAKGTTKVIDVDELKLGPDGSFDFVLSRQRPEGYQGEWIEMTPRASNLLMRSAAYDWVHERDGVASIERIDIPVQRPRMSAEELSKRMAALPGWIEMGLMKMNDRFADLKEKKVVNRLETHDYASMGGTLFQVYLEGLFQLEDDEALIIETTIPKTCKYWGFLVGNDQMATIDWMNRQSSLNAFQAKLDKDGKFRGVISNRDPGVPNWLDAGGYKFGVVQGRWHRCESNPSPSTRKVKLADVRKYLPKETPVVTPEQRDTALRDRRMGAQFRRRW